MAYASVAALLASAVAVLLGFPSFALMAAGLAQLLLSSLEVQSLVALYV